MKIFLSEYVSPGMAKWLTFINLGLLAGPYLPWVKDYLTWLYPKYMVVVAVVTLLSMYYVAVSYVK